MRAELQVLLAVLGRIRRPDTVTRPIRGPVVHFMRPNRNLVARDCAPPISL